MEEKLKAKDEEWQERVKNELEEKSSLLEQLAFLQSKMEEVSKNCGELQESLNASESRSNELIEELSSAQEELKKQEEGVTSSVLLSLSYVSFL